MAWLETVMCSDQQPAARSSTQKIKGWCGWRSTATAQQYMDCQQAEGISKNPWVPLPPNPAKKVPVSKKARTELRELWPPTAIINRCHPAPKSPQVDKRVQRQRLIPPREAGSRGPRPGESKRGRRPDQGHKGGGGASSAYPQSGRRRGETTTLGPIPVPPPTGMAKITESGLRPARTGRRRIEQS